MSKITKFGSKFGTLAVIAGSVIGLGNIWRFPYVVGENGGAAFIVTYIIITLFISIPLMLAEFILGRGSRRNSMRAFRKFDKRRSLFWKHFGIIGIITTLFMLSFYPVIAGWAVKYLLESFKGAFHDQTTEQLAVQFKSFIANGWESIAFTLTILTGCSAIVSMGINKGIERYNKILMPIMVIILLGMAINSITMSGFSSAINFLLTPDFSKINTDVVLEALGQSFFSMSIGIGVLITYGSYISKEENLFKISGAVAISDLSIALLSGLAIFPAVFTYGINPTSGPELVFLTLPYAFSMMPAGYFISIIFFFLLIFAAITTVISLIEVLVKYLCEEFSISRKTAIIISLITTSSLSSLCVISQMDNSVIKIGNLDLFDFFNYITSNYFIPIGGVLTAVFIGWFVNKKRFYSELTTNYTYGTKIASIIYILLKFVIPIIIAILFLSRVGMI